MVGSICFKYKAGARWGGGRRPGGVFRLTELVSARGERFFSQAVVRIGEREYALNTLTTEQRLYIGGALQVQALNAVFGPHAVVRADNLPEADWVFPPASSEEQACDPDEQVQQKDKK